MIVRKESIMLRILNITAIAFYALWGLFTLAIRFFADHPVGYSIELFTVDMTVFFCLMATLGFIALMQQKKLGLSLIMVATAGLLILSPFTEQILFVPLYVILAIFAWLIFRQIGKPIPVPKK
jgi:hypothetical protein